MTHSELSRRRLVPSKRKVVEPPAEGEVQESGAEEPLPSPEHRSQPGESGKPDAEGPEHRSEPGESGADSDTLVLGECHPSDSD